MKKVGLISLGCAKNLVDSEMILGLLDDDGYEITNDPKTADIIIINTCGFIESAKKESIETIFNILNMTKAKVVVTGCLAERYYETLKQEMPEVSLFIPIKQYPEFNKHFKEVDEELDRCDGLIPRYRLVSTPKYTAYLRISDGCDNCCTYCAIPLIRGHFKSRAFNDVLMEAKVLDLKGYKELVVISQDTTKYGIDLKNHESIEMLLKILLKETHFEYIRLLYLYPDEISDELIELFKTEKRLTPYFDIPIQHSESNILKKMNRRGDKEFLLELFYKIRSRVPNAILRTTVMVGFPYETDEDINNLIDFMKEVRFDHLGCFTYSKEEGTTAFYYPQIDEETKKKRLDLVMKEQAKISYSNNKKHIGEIMEGIVMGEKGDSYLLRSYWNAPDGIDGNIYFSSEDKLSIGQNVKVLIEKASIYDLEGKRIIDNK